MSCSDTQYKVVVKCFICGFNMKVIGGYDDVTIAITQECPNCGVPMVVKADRQDE